MLSLILAFFVSCISESVFICTGTTAEVYHKSDNCRGLNRCGGDVKRISLKKQKSCIVDHVGFVLTIRILCLMLKTEDIHPPK